LLQKGSNDRLADCLGEGDLAASIIESFLDGSLSSVRSNSVLHIGNDSLANAALDVHVGLALHNKLLKFLIRVINQLIVSKLHVGGSRSASRRWLGRASGIAAILERFAKSRRISLRLELREKHSKFGLQVGVAPIVNTKESANANKVRTKLDDRLIVTDDLLKTHDDIFADSAVDAQPMEGVLGLVLLLLHVPFLLFLNNHNLLSGRARLGGVLAKASGNADFVRRRLLLDPRENNVELGKDVSSAEINDVERRANRSDSRLKPHRGDIASSSLLYLAYDILTKVASKRRDLLGSSDLNVVRDADSKEKRNHRCNKKCLH